MAPDGHWCAISATASGVAASGWIHSPCTLGTNTSGCDRTQPREWMHFFASKRMRIFLPSTISMGLTTGSSFQESQYYATQERPNASNCRPIPTAQRSEIHLGSFDSRDSLPDAGDPAKEEKGEEGPSGS